MINHSWWENQPIHYGDSNNNCQTALWFCLWDHDRDHDKIFVLKQYFSLCGSLYFFQFEVSFPLFNTFISM